MTPCSLVDSYQRFGGICYPQLQIRNDFCPKREASVRRSLKMTTAGSSETLQGATTEKTAVFFLVSWGGVRLNPLGTSATTWPTVPAPDDR
jgi:hypothetical protein